MTPEHLCFKVILLEALLSVPLTAWELKVLICIQKITQEAQFVRPVGEEKVGKKEEKKKVIEVMEESSQRIHISDWGV